MKNGVRRKEVYDFIVKYRDEHGFAPALRDISAGMSLSLAAVAFHVKNLSEDGLISYQKGISRSIVVN